MLQDKALRFRDFEGPLLPTGLSPAALPGAALHPLSASGTWDHPALEIQPQQYLPETASGTAVFLFFNEPFGDPEEKKELSGEVLAMAQ